MRPSIRAGVKVNPGDIITADEDSIVAVPKAHAADVLKKAQELDNTEHSTIPFIEKFRSIKEAVARFGRIQRPSVYRARGYYFLAAAAARAAFSSSNFFLRYSWYSLRSASVFGTE